MYKIYYLTSILDCFQPRYIGYSKNPQSRLSYHINEAKYKKNRSHKVRWISKVLKNDCCPITIVLDECCSENEACELERKYIEEFRKWYRLTNSTNGGEISKSYTEDVVKRIKDGLKEYYRNNDSWNKGQSYKLDEETRIKRREGLGDKIDGENNHFFGKHHSKETRLLISSKNRIFDYDYDLFYEYYIVKNMDRNEMSKAIGLSSKFCGKMIYKYRLSSIKKKVYGKIKGKKVKIEDMELMYRYYDHDRF